MNSLISSSPFTSNLIYLKVPFTLNFNNTKGIKIPTTFFPEGSHRETSPQDVLCKYFSPGSKSLRSFKNKEKKGETTIIRNRKINISLQPDQDYLVPKKLSWEERNESKSIKNYET